MCRLHTWFIIQSVGITKTTTENRLSSVTHAKILRIVEDRENTWVNEESSNSLPVTKHGTYFSKMQDFRNIWVLVELHFGNGETLTVTCWMGYEKKMERVENVLNALRCIKVKDELGGIPTVETLSESDRRSEWTKIAWWNATPSEYKGGYAGGAVNNSLRLAVSR